MGKNDEDDKTRRIQEAVILQDFMVATQRKVEQIRLKLGTANVDLQLSDGEKKILNNIHSAGMMEGIIAGVASFVLLRRFPRYLARLQQQRSSRSGGSGSGSGSGGGNGSGYVLDQPPGKMDSPFSIAAQQQQRQQPFQQQQPPYNGGDEPLNRGGLLWRSFQFTLDLTISFLVAANVSAYMADVEHLKSTVQEIPLMEGRSGISDNFCPILVQEFQRQYKMDPNTPVPASKNAKQRLAPFDRKDVLKDPHSNLLQGYVGFIKNCRKRQAVERRIRQEQGMRPDEPVAIPSPGISSSESDDGGDDDWDDSSFAIGGGSGGGGNAFFSDETQLSGGDDDWSKDDVSSFVSDQEDSRK